MQSSLTIVGFAVFPSRGILAELGIGVIELDWIDVRVAFVSDVMSAD